jgi:hypothetical protein
MSQERLFGKTLCQALMYEVCRAIHAYAEGKTDLLRHGPRNRIQEETGKNILAIRSINMTEEQLDALEASFREVQISVVARLCSLIDGSSQPPGWPEEIRLVNMDTGEVICPDGLEWALGLALAEYRAQLGDGNERQTKDR